jgi:putative endonuclease
VPFVYILRCRDGSLYTGAAKDLARRLVQHAAGRASKYTRSRCPVSLAWSRRVRTWSRALQLEILIKRLSRAEKLALVAGTKLKLRRARPSRPTRRASSLPPS